jgi:Protein of unknown function (DUF2934)
MKKSKKPSPAAAASPAALARPTPSREEITRRAEALWLQKGRPENCDEQIWLEAESQLKGAPGAGLPGAELSATLPLSRLDLNSDEVMSELGELFPEPSGKETTSL